MKRWPEVLLTIMLLLATTGLLGADLQEARDHKNHGRFDQAIEAYRKILEASPGDQVALRELAQVTSWSGEYQVAIELYQQALEQDPSDDEALLGLARTYSWASEHNRSLKNYDRYLERHAGDERIRLERAKVKSWSGAYAEVIEYYEEHLAGNPDDQEVRLELAKVLSWAGKLNRSVDEYRVILDAEPDNIEAQVGLARTLSWSGNLSSADNRYDAILSSHPQHVGARLGKAQLALWRGETRRGHELLDALDSDQPGNAEVARYRIELQQHQKPVIESSYDQVDDNDGNEYRVTQVAATGHLTTFTTLTGIARRAETRLDGGEATVDFVGLRFGASLPHGVELRVTGGVDFIDPSVFAEGLGMSDDEHSRAVGTVAAFGPITGTWRWNAAVDHRTFDALREVVDRDITFESLNAGAEGLLGEFKVGLSGGLADFSDDNSRIHFTTHFLYPWDLAGDVHIELGYRFRFMDFDQNLDNGYFDPQSFYSNLVLFTARGPLFAPRADWAVRLEGGIQSFDQDENEELFLAGGEEDNESVFGWEVRFGIDLPRRLRLEAYYGETDYALNSATGFESDQWGILVRYRF